MYLGLTMNGGYSLLSIWVFAWMPAVTLGAVLTLNHQLGNHKIVGEALNLKRYTARSTIHCGAICGSNQNCTLYSLCATPSTRFECTVYMSAEPPELTKNPECNAYYPEPPGLNMIEVDSPVVKGISAFLWRDSVGNNTMNLELSRVFDVQMCSAICQTFTDGNCLLFSYSQSADGKCVIPKCTDDNSWIYSNDTRAFEVDSTAAVYFVDLSAFNTTSIVQAGYVIVDGTFSEAGGSELGLPYFSFTGSSLQECLILCHVFNPNCSNHFRYTLDGSAKLCGIPHRSPPFDMSDLSYVPTHHSYVYVDKTVAFAKWKLMSKHVAYQGPSPHTSYTMSGNQVGFATLSDIMPTFDSITNQTPYLKNSLIDLWSSLSTRCKIRVELYMADGTFLKYIEHDASLSNSSDDWFSADKFISSSWSDLTGVSGSYYRWEMVGEYDRTFHISRTPDSGCGSDDGWLVIQSANYSGCVEWDQIDPNKQLPPRFIYSGSSDAVIWANDMAEFDVLMIKMSFN